MPACVLKRSIAGALTLGVLLGALLGGTRTAVAEAPGAPIAALAPPAPHIVHSHEPAAIHLTTDVDPAARALLLDRLRTFQAALAQLIPSVTGVTPEARELDVLLFANGQRYAAHIAEHAPKLAHNGGYYDGAKRRVVTYLEANPLQLALHEVVHAVLGEVFDDPNYRRYARPRWPVWFDEGFAEVASSMAWRGSQLTFGTVHAARLATAADALERGRFPSLRALLTAPPARFNGPGNALWYAASWSLVDLLVAEPDLRERLPGWIVQLRAGKDGLRSFIEFFGPELGTLEKRLHQRISTLSMHGPQPGPLVSPHGLDEWTTHAGGRWRLEKGVLHGAGSPEQWGFLTRAVAPSRSVSMSFEVARDAGLLGLVLGHHGVDRYPYHTMIEFEADRVSTRLVSAPNRVRTQSRRPLNLSSGAWSQIRVSFAAQALRVWVDDALVLTAPAGGASVSLVGLYIGDGRSRVRNMRIESRLSPKGSLSKESNGE